jgi:hypothetical protein
MLDVQAQFVMTNLQQHFESLNLLPVHAINAMPCFALTKVMLVTV